MDNKETFMDTLTKEYEYLFENDPEYAFSASRTMPRQLAARMTEGLRAGTANKDGKGIKKTCQKLGIAYTYKAIKEYLS